MSKPPARRYGYDPKQAERILEALAEGATMRDACEAVGVSRKQVWRWDAYDVEGFTALLASAREHQAEALADQIVDIAREVQREEIAPDAGRVAIDAYKWMATKLKPRTFGDRMTHRLEASEDFVSALEQIESKHRARRAKVIEGDVVDVTDERS